MKSKFLVFIYSNLRHFLGRKNELYQFSWDFFPVYIDYLKKVEVTIVESSHR